MNEVLHQRQAETGAALASEQPAQTSALFDADSYWRDLVAFTWNVRTQEGPAAIADMLAARAADTAASGSHLTTLRDLIGRLVVTQSSPRDVA